MDIDKQYISLVTNSIFKNIFTVAITQEFSNYNYTRNYTNNYKNRLLQNYLYVPDWWSKLMQSLLSAVHF